MPGPNFPYTNLDADQVLKQSFDEINDRLRVDASVTAVVAGVTLSAATSDIAIKDRVTGNLLKINADGSIDSNVVVSASGGDNIAISDGTNTLDINSDGSINVKATDLDIRNLTFATDKVDVSGSNVNVTASDLDIRNLSALQDNVAISNGTTSLAINLDGSLNVAGVATETTLSSVETSVQSIDAKLPALGPNVAANSISVTLATNQSSLDVNLDAFTNVDPDSVQLVGSINGSKTGTKYGIVNNLRLQILDSHDRIALFSYADFGTKNQRITQIDYSSVTFPGSTVRRQFSYSLVGTNYRRDNETWTIV